MVVPHNEPSAEKSSATVDASKPVTEALEIKHRKWTLAAVACTCFSIETTMRRAVDRFAMNKSQHCDSKPRNHRHTI